MTEEMMKEIILLLIVYLGFAILLKKQRQLCSAPHGLSPISRTAWAVPLAEGESKKASRRCSLPALTQFSPHCVLLAKPSQVWAGGSLASETSVKLNGNSACLVWLILCSETHTHSCLVRHDCSLDESLLCGDQNSVGSCP